MELPMVVVYRIRDYMPWRYRAILVSREWLQGALRIKLRRLRWRTKRRLFSYMRVFGRQFVNVSWPRFSIQVLDLNRRARNARFQLTWRAAAEKYFSVCRCVGCGRRTYSQVFDIYLCEKCRYRRRLVNCYMVKVYQAKGMGIPKRILDRVPYHQGMGCRLRFWRDIECEMQKE